MLIAFYADDTYELFTAYQACRPNATCTLNLVYTKSIKGRYDYDVNKIIKESTDVNDMPIAMVYNVDFTGRQYDFFTEMYFDGYHDSRRFCFELEMMNLDLVESEYISYVITRATTVNDISYWI